MWGYPRPVLGAVDPLLEPFRGRLSPNIDNVSEKLTLGYPREGPWVANQEQGLLSSGYGTYKAVKVRLWPWPSRKSPQNLSRFSPFTRTRNDGGLLGTSLTWSQGGVGIPKPESETETRRRERGAGRCDPCPRPCAASNLLQVGRKTRSAAHN